MSKLIRNAFLVVAGLAGLFADPGMASADYWNNYWRWHDGYYAPYYRGYHRGLYNGYYPYGGAYPGYGYGVAPGYGHYGVYGPTTYYYGPYGGAAWR